MGSTSCSPFATRLTLLVFCRCVGRIVQSKLSVGFFSLFTVGLARPPALLFLCRQTDHLPLTRSSRRCSARESGKLRFLLSHVWDLRESGGCKKICLRFPVLFLHSPSFFFPSQTEGKFIFSAVSANPICKAGHRPPRSLTSIAENVNRRKRIKMNFLHERRHRFPNFRAALALSHDGV